MRQEINLFDPALRRPKVVLPARQVAAGWGAVALLMLAVFAWQTWRLEALKAERQSLRATAARLQAEIQQTASAVAARKPSEDLAARFERGEAGFRARQRALERLREDTTAGATGHSPYLVALARHALRGVWLTQVTVNGAEGDVIIEGRSVDPELVSEYLRRLGTDVPFRGQAFNRLEFRRPEPAVADSGGPAREAAWVEFVVASVSGGAGRSAPH